MKTALFRRWMPCSYALLIAACATSPADSPRPAAGGAPAPAPPAPEPVDVEARLRVILADEISPAQDSAFERLAGRHPHAVSRRLGTIALDRAAAPLARANAVVRMGELGVRDWTVYHRAMEDPDPRTRGAVLGAASGFFWQEPDNVHRLMVRGLMDRDPRVQAKALQEIGDRDAAAMRWFLARDTSSDLRAVALDLLRMAEERGAPLVPDDDGVLERTALSGVRIRFEPHAPAETSGTGTRQFGRLLAAAPQGRLVPLADSVLVVDNVVPAAVSSSGRHVAYEADSTLHVRDLSTGADRRVGTGIAPRSFPFTDDFVYFAPTPDPPRTREGAVLPRFEVRRAGFEAGAPSTLTSITLPPDSKVRTVNALRRARILDQEGQLVLVSTGFAVRLPSPFAEPTP